MGGGMDRIKHRLAEMKQTESCTKESDSLVIEMRGRPAVSGVPQDTRNPVGMREDHLLRLNTT